MSNLLTMTGVPAILRDFLTYSESIRNLSRKTVNEYFLDLRVFFRYLKHMRGLVPLETPLSEISIMDVDLEFVKSITLSDVYAYLNFLNRHRERHANSPNTEYGLLASSRARKVACIRSFYKYLTSKAHLLEVNPMLELDAPRTQKKLPRYLSLDESVKLLNGVTGRHSERDYCIITLFLNCGLRVSELVGINISDISENTVRVTGKGGKERILYLNEACLSAIAAYLEKRPEPKENEKALFLSNRKSRISVDAVQRLIYKQLLNSGLDASRYSPHKLRHTAATLMLKNGVDIRTIQELLGHEHLNTTQIYTHVSNEDLRGAANANPLARVKR